MKKLLQAIAATAFVPALPNITFAKTATVAGEAVNPATYKWAEMIVRAHNQSSVGMLQRLLHLDAGAASAMQSELVNRGVLVPIANEFGIHTAVKPLYEGAFVKPHSPPKQSPAISKKQEDMADPTVAADEEAMLLMIAAVDAMDTSSVA